VAQLEVSALDGPGSPVVLAMIGEFDLANVQPLKDCLAAWVIQGNREAIIDLTDTELIDSTLIGVLVTAQVAGMSLTVRGATGTVRRALDLAQVGDIVKIEESGPGSGERRAAALTESPDSS
jgi:anti-anti-sigma factor